MDIFLIVALRMHVLILCSSIMVVNKTQAIVCFTTLVVILSIMHSTRDGWVFRNEFFVDLVDLPRN